MVCLQLDNHLDKGGRPIFLILFPQNTSKSDQIFKEKKCHTALDEETIKKISSNNVNTQTLHSEVPTCRNGARESLEEIQRQDGAF